MDCRTADFGAELEHRYRHEKEARSRYTRCVRARIQVVKCRCAARRCAVVLERHDHTCRYFRVTFMCCVRACAGEVCQCVMYVCMHRYFTYMYIYLHAQRHARMYICIHTHTCICVYLSIQTSIIMCNYIYYIHTQKHAYVNIEMLYTHKHAYVHTEMLYIYIHTQTCICTYRNPTFEISAALATLDTCEKTFLNSELDIYT